MKPIYNNINILNNNLDYNIIKFYFSKNQSPLAIELLENNPNLINWRGL